jgi:riboflavin kinase/FMN adenylyltransferase
MKELRPQEAVAAADRGATLAIGNFDGLHRGHQRLLDVARDHARAAGTQWGIVSFEPHPRTFFRPEDPVFRLTPHALKLRLARALGAGLLATLAFDDELSGEQPEEFVRRHLVERLGVGHVVTGYDFHFGKGRKGSPETLRELGRQLGFGVTIVEQVADEDEGRAPFASSSIRSALRRGHVRAAARELGYHWTVMGEVVHGDKRGRTIGFPTANIILEQGAEPFRGIYAVKVRDAAAGPDAGHWLGAAYFGDRPTFATQRTFLEVFLLDETRDLYGHTLLVSFVDLIRPDQSFTSVEALVAQMNDDCAAARRILTAPEPALFSRLGELQATDRI